MKLIKLEGKKIRHVLFQSDPQTGAAHLESTLRRLAKDVEDVVELLSAQTNDAEVSIDKLNRKYKHIVHTYTHTYNRNRIHRNLSC